AAQKSSPESCSRGLGLPFAANGLKHDFLNPDRREWLRMAAEAAVVFAAAEVLDKRFRLRQIDNFREDLSARDDRLADLRIAAVFGQENAVELDAGANRRIAEINPDDVS